MAKGHNVNQVRVRELQLLGKDLVRRAKSRCELTGVAGVPLRPYEVPPVPASPELERTLLLSEATIEALRRPDRMVGRDWRCLVQAVWSDLPARQVVAWRMLHQLASREDWARESLDEVFLDPTVEAWAKAVPL